MGQKEKLIAKLKASSKSFTFNEAETLLGYFSYHRSNKGKTLGAIVAFFMIGTPAGFLVAGMSISSLGFGVEADYSLYLYNKTGTRKRSAKRKIERNPIDHKECAREKLRDRAATCQKGKVLKLA